MKWHILFFIIMTISVVTGAIIIGYDDAENPKVILKDTTPFNVSVYNVTRSEYWGNYLYSDYNMLTGKTFWFNQTIGAQNFGFANFHNKTSNITLRDFSISGKFANFTDRIDAGSITSAGLCTFGSNINSVHIGGDMDFDGAGELDMHGGSIVNIPVISGVIAFYVDSLQAVSYMDVGTIYDTSYGTTLKTGSKDWVLSTNLNITGNATINDLISLKKINQPTCNIKTNGSIVRNQTNCLNYCNGIAWQFMAC